jgi:peptide deformylase
MTIKPVVKMGNRHLSTASVEVKDFSAPGLKALVEDMTDTMRATNGVGIAAPQIGVNLRVVVVGFEKNERYPGEEAVPLRALINPRLEILDYTLLDGWEGCLSVPGLRGLVPRHKKIRCRGSDIEGTLVMFEASGFQARVWQHEVDHLDGILFPQRMENMNTFTFEDELAARAGSSSDSVQQIT